MAEMVKVNVTITGHYFISDSELQAYGVTEFDPEAMVQVDRDQIVGPEGAEEIISWLKPGLVIALDLDK